ncbi:MAG: hypothetical protein HDR00_08855 [Lachnospiraceae bacterium]|nr:hypothetical protein [Lachnospiraceae bacterium]
MQGCKKLFQRDKIFLLCLSGVVALTLLFTLFQCRNMIKQDIEMIDMLLGFHGEEFLAGAEGVWSMLAGMTQYAITNVMKAALVIVVIAQFVKWNVLEGKRGKEFQNLLPVKSSACVTYDYICGILFLWVPAVIMGITVSILTKPFEQYEQMGILNMSGIMDNIWSEVGRELIIVSFIYSFLVFAKKITRYIPGILLLMLICNYMILWVSGTGYSLLWDWGFYNAGYIREYILFLLMALVFVALSYFCDRKRDIAGNGLFYFKPVHFLVMLMIFAELFSISVTGIILPSRVMTSVVSLILAALVTVGVHYLTWGRKAR